MEESEKKRLQRLNIGSMNAETRRALDRFEATTGLKALRFKSNRHAMQYWFSVWVDGTEPIVQKAIEDYPDVKNIKGIPFDFLLDETEKEVRFDIDRNDLL